MVLLLLFYVLPIVCGVCFGMHYFVSFLVLQIVLTGKRELVTGCFLMSCYCWCFVALPRGAVGWSAVRGCGIS